MKLYPHDCPGYFFPRRYSPSITLSYSFFRLPSLPPHSQHLPRFQWHSIFFQGFFFNFTITFLFIFPSSSLNPYSLHCIHIHSHIQSASFDLISYFMGHNVSSVHGVKSSDFYTPGNAVNEIWVDNVELISRLPFGDSDLGQAGWPAHDWPKIPWHNFIIPLKRDLEGIQNPIVDENLNMSLLHIIPDSCATPLILGIDNVWAPLLFMTGITIIGSGFVLLLAVASEVMDIHQLLRRSDRLPLRMVPQLRQPRNVRRWARDYLKPFVYDILAVIISMGLGFPIAVSSARCLDPLFTFSVIMISQAVFLLSFFGFCLFCFNRTVKKAATRNDGDEQDQAAETRLAQLEIDVQIATTITTIDQPPSASVDFDKAVESNPL